ncbi:uncharacterized protein A4U43_C07F21620 [Asparagus officinalis]|uniref:RxLR effector protein n=1 Tax=Asparagus officinalis TaxID=4686 RepID=A0A5P1EDZ7_ASPOF|nr:uncharacterized protein A4U43_C07F21620 [Asparagus officinalis]
MRLAITVIFLVSISLSLALAAITVGGGDLLDPANATVAVINRSAKDNFANMFDRVLQKEFPESEQSTGEKDR